MHKWNKILKKICYPHIVIVVILTTISILGLIYSFAIKNAIPFLQYLFYAISAYTLTIICFRTPHIIKKIQTLLQSNKLAVKYKSDIQFRNKISLYINTCFNASFALFYIVTACFNKSLWFYFLSAYYTLLSIMRLFLLKDTYKHHKLSITAQWQRYRFCGIVLLVIHSTCAAIVFFAIKFNKGFSYHFIETIAVALFTFVTTTIAIINSIKYRKFHQPIISAIKYVSLSSALVSMFSLETAMLTTFGTTADYLLKSILLTLTGAAVCLIVLIIGIYMTIKSSKEINELNNLKNNK